jgi:hypothetical protein
MPLLITGEEREGCWHAPSLWYPEHARHLLHVEPRTNLLIHQEKPLSQKLGNFLKHACWFDMIKGNPK